MRPAVIVNEFHTSRDIFIVPITSRITSLLAGEFLLNDWQAAGLNAIKRGIYTVEHSLVLKRIGQLAARDAITLDQSLREWLSLP